MKQILVKKGFPYFGTKVPLDRTISQIKDMLRKFGCDKIAEMDDTIGTHIIAFTNKNKSYLIDFPMTIIQTGTGKKILEQRPDIGARIIHDRVKALLISVELEFLEFDQAMLPYLLVRGNNGVPTTLEKRISEIHGTIDQLFLPSPNEVKHDAKKQP